MPSKPVLLGAAFMLVSTVASAGECRQDLSGEWSREAKPGGTPEETYRAEGSGWSDRIRVVQDGGRVTIESFFYSRGDMQPPLRFTYLPGEGVTENVVMVGQGGQRQVSTSLWSDCRLVITTRYLVNDGASAEGSVTQALWLESGTALVVETTRGAAKPNRTVYRREAVAGGK
jgi:hypothetical protein